MSPLVVTSIFLTVTVTPSTSASKGLQVLLERRVKPDGLLGFRVRVDDGFFD